MIISINFIQFNSIVSEHLGCKYFLLALPEIGPKSFIWHPSKSRLPWKLGLPPSFTDDKPPPTLVVMVAILLCSTAPLVVALPQPLFNSFFSFQLLLNFPNSSCIFNKLFWDFVLFLDMITFYLLFFRKWSSYCSHNIKTKLM